MGQAKRRGTFEERKRMAITRDDADFKLKVEKEIARRANMTEKEKAAEYEMRLMFSSYMGVRFVEPWQLIFLI